MVAMRNILDDLPLALLDPGWIGLPGKCAHAEHR
jgi:hypothetical protein